MNSQVTTESQSDFTPWHAVAADEVIRRLDTNVQSGLSAANVQQRLEKYGHNRLPEGRKQGPFKRFLLQFNNILVYVLLGAGFVKLMCRRISVAIPCAACCANVPHTPSSNPTGTSLNCSTLPRFLPTGSVTVHSM